MQVRILLMPMIKNQTVQRYLMNIYGINKARSKKLIEKLGISNITFYQGLPEYKKDLLVQTITQIRKQKPGLDTDLIVFEKSRVEKEIDLQTYKGLRRKQGYPVRGQRTRSNGKTAKRFKFK